MGDLERLYTPESRISIVYDTWTYPQPARGAWKESKNEAVKHGVRCERSHRHVQCGVNARTGTCTLRSTPCRICYLRPPLTAEAGNETDGNMIVKTAPRLGRISR